jgi:hypothetical protein
MSLFGKKPKITGCIEGTPEGTFRCDVCGFVQPDICRCGVVADSSSGEQKTYTLCGTCALWLGMGTSRFPQVLMYNFSDKQRQRIDSLKTEIEKLGGSEGLNRQAESMAAESATNQRRNSDPGVNLDMNRKFQDEIPNLKGLLKYRQSTLPAEYIELSARLTRGEPVSPKEIKKANK